MNTYNIDKMYENYSSEVERMQKCIDELLQENKQLKEVIDKAIEWVRDWTQVKNDWFEEDSKPSELLDILKEVSE